MPCGPKRVPGRIGRARIEIGSHADHRGVISADVAHILHVRCFEKGNCRHAEAKMSGSSPRENVGIDLSVTRHSAPGKATMSSAHFCSLAPAVGRGGSRPSAWTDFQLLVCACRSKSG